MKVPLAGKLLATLGTTSAPRGRRLRRSDCSAPGLRRARRGRGFTYLDEGGNRVRDQEVLERVRALAVPPAWQEVWICADPRGHLQATGIDAAGRKQYLYHELWRARRDRAKFDRMIRFAEALPKLRRRLTRELDNAEPSRDRVLACAVRMLDIGLFRIGGEQYADDDSGIGLATIRREHVSFDNGSALFDYPAKGGVRRVHAIQDPTCVELVRTLRRRRGGAPELLAYRNARRWVSVRSDDITGYLKRALGDEFSPKDFRTWNATVLAAVSLAARGADASTKTARKRRTNEAVKGVAAVLGNTPAVARRSYIDPRVFDRYQAGWTIAGALGRIGGLEQIDERARGRIERAVLDLLEGDYESPAIAKAAPPA
jgi:DNA topoisomerase-1